MPHLTTYVHIKTHDVTASQCPSNNPELPKNSLASTQENSLTMIQQQPS